MKEILETMILNLVDDKESVEIKETDNEKSIIFEISSLPIIKAYLSSKLCNNECATVNA